MRSLFRADLGDEQVLQGYLDRCYRHNGIRSVRFADREHQRDGIDVQLEKDGNRFRVDEKAQLHYLDRSLPTFALELSLLKDGRERPGWSVDPTKRTEVYAFVFDIRTAAGVTRLERPEDVVSAAVVLVNRDRLRNTLAAAGLDEAVLRRLNDELRRTGEHRRSVRAPGVRVVLTPDLAERPVNLLVLRSHLEAIGQVLRLCSGPSDGLPSF